MRDYDRNKPLISIHVPKCAGNSFTSSVLKKWYRRNLYLHYFNEKRNKMPKRVNLRKSIFRKEYKNNICIHGHFNKSRGFGAQDYYPGVDQFITILRDPFEMAISNYFYCKKLKENRYRNGNVILINEMHENIIDYLNNAKSFLSFHMPFDMTKYNYKELIDKYFIYIGITEDLQTSINKLSLRLGYPSIKVDRLNISQRDEIVSEGIKEQFVRNNELEYLIYDYALMHYKV